MTLIDRHTKRLLKELRVFLARNHPDFCAFPEFFAPTDFRSTDEFVDSIDAVHTLEALPWPERPCILYAEGMNGFDFFPAEFRELSDTAKSVSAFIIDGDGSLWSLHARRVRPTEVEIGTSLARGQVARVRFQSTPGGIVDRMISAKANLRQWFDDAVATFSPPGTRVSERQATQINQAIENFCESQVPRCEAPWQVRNPAWQENVWDYMPSLVAAFANIVTPCHYRLKSYFTEPFGDQRTKQCFAHKPIFSLVKYDRVYRVATGCGEHDVPPHFRRGHVRHMWLESGIDRLCLPPDPALRQRLAQERKVRRVVVSPCWVGQREFDDDGMHHEILAEES